MMERWERRGVPSRAWRCTSGGMGGGECSVLLHSACLLLCSGAGCGQGRAAVWFGCIVCRCRKHMCVVSVLAGSKDGSWASAGGAPAVLLWWLAVCVHGARGWGWGRRGDVVQEGHGRCVGLRGVPAAVQQGWQVVRGCSWWPALPARSHLVLAVNDLSAPAPVQVWR